jgi:hypothetical protein
MGWDIVQPEQPKQATPPQRGALHRFTGRYAATPELYRAWDKDDAATVIAVYAKYAKINACLVSECRRIKTGGDVIGKLEPTGNGLSVD